MSSYNDDSVSFLNGLNALPTASGQGEGGAGDMAYPDDAFAEQLALWTNASFSFDQAPGSAILDDKPPSSSSPPMPKADEPSDAPAFDGFLSSAPSATPSAPAPAPAQDGDRSRDERRPPQPVSSSPATSNGSSSVLPSLHALSGLPFAVPSLHATGQPPALDLNVLALQQFLAGNTAGLEQAFLQQQATAQLLHQLQQQQQQQQQQQHSALASTAVPLANLGALGQLNFGVPLAPSSSQQQQRPSTVATPAATAPQASPQQPLASALAPPAPAAKDTSPPPKKKSAPLSSSSGSAPSRRSSNAAPAAKFETPEADDAASSPLSVNIPDPSVDSEAHKFAIEEDKRRRNTAASARFRIKKKMREQALEASHKELSSRVRELEAEVEGLRRENGWLKSLITIRPDQQCPSQLPSTSTSAAGSDNSTPVFSVTAAEVAQAQQALADPKPHLSTVFVPGEDGLHPRGVGTASVVAEDKTQQKEMRDIQPAHPVQGLAGTKRDREE